MKNWKYIAFVSYKKIQEVVSILDFNYQIEIADKRMKSTLEELNAIVSLTSVKDSEFYVEKEDAWHLCVNQIIIQLQDACKETSEIRRKERYYAILNYVIDFIEINDDEC